MFGELNICWLGPFTTSANIYNNLPSIEWSSIECNDGSRHVCFPVSETDDIASMVVLGMSEIGQRKQLIAALQGSQLITLKFSI